jgi:hypothetical protein
VLRKLFTAEDAENAETLGFSNLFCALSALCGERLLDRLEGSGVRTSRSGYPVNAVSSLLKKLFTAEDAENAETLGFFDLLCDAQRPLR